MNVTDRLKSLDFKGRDFPILKGDVKMTLKNVHNGKTEVFEKHNLVTNALSDIFGNNYGGLVNYNSFADLYKTYLGGVLVFASALDSDPTNYGIPAYTSNPVTAHAGQTHLTSQNDDSTRGNPDDSATVLTSGSTKMVWEWGTNAGNGQISSLGLTHSDVGSFGCGSRSDGASPTCLQNLNPFADVGLLSRSYSYGNNSDAVLAINNNVAYNFYLVDATTVKIYKSPINCTKFKLQGGSMLPLTDYTASVVTATVQSCTRVSAGDCYYDFDFANDTLTLFRVATEGGERLLIDTINLTSGTVTSSYVDISGAKLWKFHMKGGIGVDNLYFSVPTQAIINNGNLFVYAYTSEARTANKMFRVNLANPANQQEVDTSLFSDFVNISESSGYSRVGERFVSLGGVIAHDSFLVNGDKAFGVAPKTTSYATGANYTEKGEISSPVIGLNTSMNMVSVSKLYLATKWTLDSSVTKKASQSMTVEYTLTEV